MLGAKKPRYLMKRFYLTAAIIGTIVPWAFFAHFFYQHGFDPIRFILGLFANGAAGGFSADILISIAVFWGWATLDARRHRVKHYWVIYPAGRFVGLSLALPLYLYLREGQSDINN